MKGLVFDSSCITNIGSSRKLSSLVVQCTRGSLNLCVPALVLTEAAGADVVTAEAAFQWRRLSNRFDEIGISRRWQFIG